MKKILLVLWTVFCLSFSLVAFATPKLTIKNLEVKQGDMQMLYPQVTIADHSILSNQINTYFANNAMQAMRNYSEERVKGVHKTLSEEYALSYYGENYLCFSSNGYMYYRGAAHPLSWMDGVTFDLATGNAVPWQKLIRNEDREDFTLEAINRKILTNQASWRQWLYRDFQGLKELPKIYYLDKEGYIHFIFGQYEIAPYAAGIIDMNMEKQCR